MNVKGVFYILDFFLWDCHHTPNEPEWIKFRGTSAALITAFDQETADRHVLIWETQMN